MKKIASLGVLTLALASGAAFAQNGGVTIPGLLTGKGSAGSEIFRSKINVIGNQASNITAGGGKASIKVADVTLDGTANVNSVNITGSKVHDSEINVLNNTATDVKAIGGTANVNSVNVN